MSMDFLPSDYAVPQSRVPWRESSPPWTPQISFSELGFPKRREFLDQLSNIMTIIYTKVNILLIILLQTFVIWTFRKFLSSCVEVIDHNEIWGYWYTCWIIDTFMVEGNVFSIEILSWLQVSYMTVTEVDMGDIKLSKFTVFPLSYAFLIFYLRSFS